MSPASPQAGPDDLAGRDGKEPDARLRELVGAQGLRPVRVDALQHVGHEPADLRLARAAAALHARARLARLRDRALDVGEDLLEARQQAVALLLQPVDLFARLLLEPLGAVA